MADVLIQTQQAKAEGQLNFLIMSAYVLGFGIPLYAGLSLIGCKWNIPYLSAMVQPVCKVNFIYRALFFILFGIGTVFHLKANLIDESTPDEKLKEQRKTFRTIGHVLYSPIYLMVLAIIIWVASQFYK
jgi:hypothetical protein